MNCARGDWPKPEIVKAIKPAFDLVSCQNVTAIQKHYLEHCKEVVEDSKQSERLDEQECVVCFYSSRVGGSAITYHMCERCGKEMSFSNTCVDILCEECASEMGVCKHCGADMEMKIRRKL